MVYHLKGALPVSSCADRDVDTRSNAGTTYTFAPSITLPGQVRPLGQGSSGYFTAYAQVAYLAGDRYALVAHSWPASGLQGAGLAVAAQNATSATLPANQDVRLDGPYTGQINSGQPDSICTGRPFPAKGYALPAGVRTYHPAFAGAPSPYEVGSPTGAYAGQVPRGNILVIHGGGWSLTGAGNLERNRGEADRWRARGFQTVNLSYRACGQSIADVAWFYDRTRAATGTAPICATGASAGGNLALLLAVYRPGVYCVVSQAGPTNLSTIRSQDAYDATTRTLNQTNGGRWVHNLGVAAFGAENLSVFSPAAHAAGSLSTTRVLQGFSEDDALIPWAQATELRDAVLAANPSAQNEAYRLPSTSLERGIVFAHGVVTHAALADFHAREAQLISAVPGGR